MASQFRGDRTMAKNVRWLMRKGLENTLETLRDPNEGRSPEAIHDARKGFKRLRALLRLVRPSLGGKRFERENKVFRDAGRGLSGARDAQVLVTVFDDLVGPGKVRARLSRDAAIRLRGKLSRPRATDARVAAPRKRVPPVAVGLEAARGRLRDDWPLHGDHWRHVGEGLRATFRQGRRALKRLQAQPADDMAWHTLRKRVKDLGYQLRALRPLWPGSLKGMGHDLTVLGEMLGDDHDLVVLRARLLDHLEPGATTADLDPFVAVIDHRRAALHAKAGTIGRRIYAEKPGDFEGRLRGLRQVRQRKEQLARPG